MSDNSLTTTRSTYIIVFAGGMVGMAAELSASRLLGPTFGVSNIVWVNIIGLMLAYLAAGYVIGGRWADRAPRVRTLFTIAGWGSFLIGLIPLAARILLPIIVTLRLPTGLAIATTIWLLFTVPVTLLGCITPFALKLALHMPGEAGQVAGRVYAVSTMGSAAGVLLPVLYTLPTLGTTATFLVFAGVLWVSSFVGLLSIRWQRSPTLLWMPVVIIALYAVL